MSFSEVRAGCVAINQSLDAIEFKLMEIKVPALRSRVAELEREKRKANPLSALDEMIQSVACFPAFQLPQIPEFKPQIPDLKFPPVPVFDRTNPLRLK